MLSLKASKCHEKAYTETCYKEVYQIAVEQEFDLDLTLASHFKQFVYF